MAAKITRKIVATEAHFVWTELVDGEPINHKEVRYFPGKLSDAQVKKALSKAFPQGVLIVSVESSEKMYFMPLDTFIRNATVVDANAPETDAEADNTDGMDGEETLPSEVSSEPVQTTEAPTAPVATPVHLPPPETLFEDLDAPLL